VPAPTLSSRDIPDDYERWVAFWVRLLLVGIVLGLSAVFGVARWLNPYDADGSARLMATHRQLGLPPCTFVEVTGVPCPACGMTTSFALLAHGDVANSLRANWVGTLLAGYCALVVPWALVSIVLGRPLFIRSLEKAFLATIIALFVLMFARWAVVVWLVLTGRM
jgi:hypothetical protein